MSGDQGARVVGLVDDIQALWTNVCECVVCVPSSCLAEGLYDRNIPVVKLLGGRGVVGMVSLRCLAARLAFAVLSECWVLGL